MKKERNYNYAFLFYDVGEKECRRYLRCVKIFDALSEIRFQGRHDSIKIHISAKRIKQGYR